MKNIKTCNSIKQYFQECGFEIKNETSNGDVYGIESEMKADKIDFKVKIIHHQKPMTITFQVMAYYKFNKGKSNTLLLIDLINMVFMNIGGIVINPETNQITITSNQFLSNQGIDEYQFKTTLERCFFQLFSIYDLFESVDLYDKDPMKLIADFGCKVQEAMKPETENQLDSLSKYFVDIPRCGPLKDNSEVVIMDMQLCLQNEGLPITNETERQSDTEHRHTKIVESWCEIESKPLRVKALYTPQSDIVGFELSGFPPVKNDYALNYIYLFNWINQMQMRNWWVLCPEINQVLFRSGFIISNGKLNKYQFRKLIKSSIENLKLFYPLMIDQERIGKDVVKAILRFSEDNIINIGRFHNK
jgi:hypothetical protein